jgi:hypothetical protein
MDHKKWEWLYILQLNNALLCFYGVCQLSCYLTGLHPRWEGQGTRFCGEGLHWNLYMVTQTCGLHFTFMADKLETTDSADRFSISVAARELFYAL